MKLLTAPAQNHRAQKTSLLQQSLRSAGLWPGNASPSRGRLFPGPRGAWMTLAVMETQKGPIGKLESILTGTRHLMAITWSSLPRTSTIAATKIVKKLAKTATEVPRLRKEQTSRWRFLCKSKSVRQKLNSTFQKEAIRSYLISNYWQQIYTSDEEENASNSIISSLLSHAFLCRISLKTIISRCTQYRTLTRPWPPYTAYSHAY